MIAVKLMSLAAVLFLNFSVGLVCSLSTVGFSALASESESGYRRTKLVVPAGGKTGFQLMPASTTGVTFTNYLSDAHAAENQIRMIGSGVAAGDVDGDGWCDLYFARLEGPNVLYRNLGNWRFEDITAAAGVACADQYSTGAVFADVDGDGDLDLLVNSIGGGTRLFFNDGKGHFTESIDSGLVRKFTATSMALADIDGDGDLDLYVTNYRTTTIRSTGLDVLNVNGKRILRPQDRDVMEITPQGFIREHGEPDILYLNDGKGHFTPVSWTDGHFLDESGRALSSPPRDWGLSVMFRDLNNDGAPDLYVCNDFWSPDRIWLNRGDGTFRAIPRSALPNTSTFSMGIDFADINRDGFDDFIVLDMLSPNHARRMRQASLIGLEAAPPGFPLDRPQVERNTLFLNRGDGTFAEIAQLSGLAASDWSWCPVFLDVDLDGFEDLLVTNGYDFDTQDIDADNRIAAQGPWPREKIPLKLLMHPRLPLPNYAFRNRGDLTFEETGRQWGFNQTGISQGMALADLDNDGDLDVIVNNMNAAAALYRNETSAARIAVRLKGLGANRAGVGARIKVTGGSVPQSQEIICGGRYLSSDDPMRVFAAGNPTNRLHIEVIWRSGRRSVMENAEANSLHEISEAGADTHAQRPASTPPIADRQSPIANPRVPGVNRQAPSADFQVPGVNRQAPFADSQAPSAKRQAPISDQSSSIINRQLPVANDGSSIFEDVRSLITHVHTDAPFDDFQRQPLLPNRLSQMGPGISWFDIDADGWDDLIIPSGRGGELAVFRNDGRGNFVRLSGLPLNQVVTRDQTTVLGWRKENQTVLLAGSSNYEDGLPIGASARQFNLATKTIDDSLPGLESSTGPMAMADLDGDGDLDLFIGGYTIPGRYPYAASSRVFRNDAGTFRLDEENSKTLTNVGLVRGAVFSDLNGDGYPELVLACEWGPVRIFRNDRGKLRAWDPPVTFARGGSTLNSQPPVPPKPGEGGSTLNQLTGWWTGVTTGDFDNDGRMDIVAGNWGRNTKYEAHRQQPLRLYYGDLAKRGAIDMVEAYFDVEMKKWVPERPMDSLAAGLAFIRSRFNSNLEYGDAGIQEILGDALKGAAELEANWLETTVFLNRGDRFESVQLPVEAQFAPVFGLAAGDFNGDGIDDIFLSQNFFATQSETSPYDGGRGLWLKGDGHGKFTAMSGQETGIAIYGEQRGCALADYDGDGRVDLAVAQNSGPTILYRNARAKPGLRVRLKGPAGNPDAIGAVVRLVFPNRLGPARELHSGSGYWSQDSATPVLGYSEPPIGIQVHWPGTDKNMDLKLPPGANEVHIDRQGAVRVIR